MTALVNRSVTLSPIDINGACQTTFVALVSKKQLQDINKVICICTAATMKLKCFYRKCPVRFTLQLNLNKCKNSSSSKLHFKKRLQNV